MKLYILFSFLFVFTCIYAEDTANGIKGELEVVDTGDHFLEIYIKFTNTRDVANAITIPYRTDGIFIFQVKDDKGKVLDKAIGIYDGSRPIPKDLVLPYKGSLRYRYSFPGLGYNPTSKNKIIDLGCRYCWRLPASGNYYLSGSFLCQKDKNLQKNWSGNIIFKPVLIPNKKLTKP
jgi:hypothetical protein